MVDNERDARPVSLRDVLALDRTVLANERTLLAYVRTAMAILASGVTVLKVFAATFVTLLVGSLLVTLGTGVLALGILRYRVLSRRLGVIHQPSRDEQDGRCS